MFRSTIARLASLTATLVCATAALPHTASASCDWTVTGTLSVEHDGSVEELGTESPLENIQVRVKARDKVLGFWGTWNSWDEVRTDDTGKFTVENTKDCSDRQFKVDVKFQDSDLEVRHSTSTSSLTKVNWYEVHQTGGSGYAPSTVNLGDLVFKPGASADRGTFEARRHADTWVLYKQAIELMASFGEAFEFQTQVKIKPIHNGITADANEAPYANPTTKVIYIINNSEGDWFNTETLLHELGHVWAYNHATGETCLTEELILEGDTHGTVTDPCVAFHEGFAEFWMEQVVAGLFRETSQWPLNRAYLNSGMMAGGDVVSSLALMQRNDEGWRSVFNTMVAIDLGGFHFFEATDSYPGFDTVERRYGAHLTGGLCSAPEVDFKSVLRVFLPMSSAGYSYDIDRSELQIPTFLTRAEGILGGMIDGDAELLRRIVNPAGDDQPYDLFCD